jgi:hypothetical protein
MKRAILTMVMIISFLCLVVPAYASDLNEVFVNFMYGTISLLLVCLIGCVGYIANKFNSNIGLLFSLVKEINDEVKSIELKCAANHPNGFSERGGK